MTRTLLRVTGTVQGVGFRPFVYRHAVALGLAGSVRNDSAGVLIDVEGEPERIAELTRVLTEEPPPLARIATVTWEHAVPRGERDGFSIVESDASGAAVGAGERRHRHVRRLPGRDRRSRRPPVPVPVHELHELRAAYTIVLGVPYDRPATTMRGFEMCPACRAEYDDPSDRRFHAQPNVCPQCGPTLTWRDPTGRALADGDDALTAAIDAHPRRRGGGGQRHRRLPPRGRRHQHRRGARAPAPQGARRQAVRGDGARSRCRGIAVRARRRRRRRARVAAPPDRARTPPRCPPRSPSPRRSRPGFPTSGCSSPTRRSTTCSWRASAARS